MRVALARVREQKGYTQKQVSERANISQGYYSEVESGIRCPSASVAKGISKVLEIKQQNIFEIFYSE